jgi:cell division transport system permease protein
MLLMFRTTFGSLLRNWPLTVAAVTAAAVAAALLGGALMVRSGVAAATIRWQGGVETIVFLEAGSSDVQVSDVGDMLRADPAVRTVRYVDADAAYDEFVTMFQNNPLMVENVTADMLPTSWRVYPVEGATEDDIDAIGTAVAGMPGVLEVVYARDAVRSVLTLSSFATRALAILAVVLGGIAWLLSFASCRAAAWARRDELAVMRLVGAPRWLVRSPFVLEGIIHGAVGAFLGLVPVWMAANALNGNANGDGSFAVLQSFSVTAADLWQISFIVLAAGAAGAGVGAFVGVGRYVGVGDGVAVTATGRVADRWRRRRIPDLAAVVRTPEKRGGYASSATPVSQLAPPRRS